MPLRRGCLAQVVKSFGVGEAQPPGIAKYRATTASEAVPSTIVESVDGCEARPQGVEVPEFVFRDRIQQRAFEQLGGFSEVVEKSVFKVFSQDQLLDFPSALVIEQLVNVPFLVPRHSPAADRRAVR